MELADSEVEKIDPESDFATIILKSQKLENVNKRKFGKCALDVL